MNGIAGSIRGWIERTREALRRRRLAREGEEMCAELALHLAEMEADAAGTREQPSPGTTQLLARARRVARRQVAPLLPSIGRGIASTHRAQTSAGEAAIQIERAREALGRAQTVAENHLSRRPDRPSVVNRGCAHPATRTAIAVLCVAIEILITAPALELLTSGDYVFNWIELHYVLAGLVGLATFFAAELAAQCLVSWLQGAPCQRPTLNSRVRGWFRRVRLRMHLRRLGVRVPPVHGVRAPRAAHRGTYARAAGFGCVVIVVGMISVLGWLIWVRGENVRAAEAIRAGDTPAAVAPIPGLPVAPAAAPSAPGGPIAFGGAPTARPAATTTEGDLGPVGALSIVAFLVALTAATLAHSTDAFTRWEREERRLRRVLEGARSAEDAAIRRQADLRAGTADGSVLYDVAGRRVANIVSDCLLRAEIWEARVRQLYAVYCRRSRRRPAALVFPERPTQEQELQELLGAEIPIARQSGGLAFGQRFVDEDDAGPPPDPPAAGRPATDAPPRAAQPRSDQARDRAGSRVRSNGGPPPDPAAEPPQRPADEADRAGDTVTPPSEPEQPSDDTLHQSLRATIDGMRGNPGARRDNGSPGKASRGPSLLSRLRRGRAPAGEQQR